MAARNRTRSSDLASDVEVAGSLWGKFKGLMGRDKLAREKKLKELHFMSCPRCGLKLQQVRFRQVDVDACFSCNGIFLDAGELEKIEKPESKGVMSAILNWFKPDAKT